MENNNLGRVGSAETGSRASTEPASRLGPTGFDPAREFAPCPLCKQYSHAIGEDQLVEAFMHFQSMFSHRGDGIPTHFCFEERTRDAAQVLMAAARDRRNEG